MSDSLQLGGLELLSGAGGTYNVLDGQRGLGDPQAVTQTIQAQLTMGSFATGSFTDNRTIKLQVLIQAADRLSLAQADSNLRAVVNASTPQALRWAPDGGYALLFDTFRGQVETQWSGKFERALARIVTITMQALPFGRSDTQRTISGSVSSTQIADFSQNPEYVYHVPDGTNQSVDWTTAILATTGTAYPPQTSPTPLEGTGCMRLDAESYHQSGTTTYPVMAAIDTVSAALNLSATPVIEIGFQSPNNTGSNAWLFALTLTDSHGVSATNSPREGNQGGGWQTATISTSDYAGVDLTNVTSWRLRMDMINGTPGQTSTIYLGSMRAYPSSSVVVSTTHGAVYKLADALGDAQAPASIEADRGGTSTISGFAVYKAPSGTPSTTPSLIGLSANTGSTTAPTTFAGTYRMILANAGGTNVAAGGTLTITQKIGATTVATATIMTATVAGGSKWADCGDITLPLVDMPDQASNTSYSFSFNAAATEVMLFDTRGFLVWIPVLPTAKPYVWVDEATAEGMGGVYAGSASDRSDATSLLGATGAQISGSMSLDPGDNYLLAYCIDGAFSNVATKYYDRYLGERTAA